MPYKIIDGQDGAAWVEVQGNKMSPSQVSFDNWLLCSRPCPWFELFLVLVLMLRSRGCLTLTLVLFWYPLSPRLA